MAILCSLVSFAILTCLAIGFVWLCWTGGALLLAKRKLRAILLGLPLAITVVAAALIAISLYTHHPSRIFEHEFGFPPPPGTTILHASASALGDSGSAYLHAKVSPATAARILTAYTPASKHFSSPETPPTWFQPPQASPTLQLLQLTSPPTPTPTSLPTPRASFASEFRQISYDPATGDLWYQFSGVD